MIVNAALHVGVSMSPSLDAGGMENRQAHVQITGMIRQENSMPNPMDNLVKLRDAIDRVAQDLHIKRESWGVVPAEKGQPDHIVVTFSIDPDIVLSEREREQKKFDTAFENIVAGPVEDPTLKALREDAAKMWDDDGDEWEEL